MPFLFYDTETTGLPRKGGHYSDPDAPRVLQLSGIVDDDERKTVGHFEFLLNYDGEVPDGAYNVHKISAVACQSFGVPAPAALSIFLSCVRNTNLVIAHNEIYDRGLMLTEFHKLQKAHILEEALQGKTFCTKEATTPILKIPSPWGRGYKWPTLTEAYCYLVDPQGFEGAHGAKADATAVRAIFYSLLDNNHIKLDDIL